MTNESRNYHFGHGLKQALIHMKASKMKNLFLLAAFVSSISLAQTTYYSDQYGMPQGSATRAGNTTYYSNQYGMPQGSATQSGNTTYYSNQYGMPQGSATQSGNTTYYNNQYGMPQGSATTIGPTPIQPIRPYGR
jgi:hypothetical protein